MATNIQFKRSSVVGKVPDAANVQVGEPVVNLADRILFTKNGSGTVIVIGAGTTSNITEGNNLYYTDARVRQALSVTTPGLYDNTTGVFNLSSNVIYNGNSEVRIALANSSIYANVSGYNAIRIDRYSTTANIVLRGQVQDASGRTLQILDEGGNVVWGN